MDKEHFYHMFANGDDAKDFIISEEDFILAFNRFAVCAHTTGVTVVSFSLEDSHPHALLWGAPEKCQQFRDLYESISIRHIARQRGSAQGVVLNCELDEITSESYLLNVAAYTITQPTKDGKAVMPYDYLYGTGALYFRSRQCILPWLIDKDGKVSTPVTLGSLKIRDRKRICGTKMEMPDEWFVCNGFILPTNYINVRHFESIYRTHNCFRVFLSNNRKRDEIIQNRMSEIRGVMFDDLEARRLCAETCQKMFGKLTTRTLDSRQRIALARELRTQFRISFRQLSFLVHIPESELRKYVR